MQVTRDFSHYIRAAGEGIKHIDLAVEGVHCAGCMAKIERGLSAIPDVTLARVNLTDRRVALEWKQGTLDPARFIDRLEELGYKAYPYETESAEATEVAESRFLLRCLGVAAFATMNVMMLSIPVWSGNVSDMLPEQRDFFHWLSALIALPAAAYAGQPFFRSAWRALSAKTTNMDVPISIGVCLALGMSVVETIHHAEHAYFDAAIMLLTFLLVGRFLDQNMRRRTRAVAGNLAALKAETAAKFVGPDEISQVPVAAIHPGDIVLLRPGERCAVDGTVIEGRSEIDQSLITGETLYVTAEQGTAVYAGSMNISGTLRVRVSAASEATLLAEITRLLDNALQARSRYMRLADRASRLYAPVVHATALITILGWVIAGASWHDAIVTGVAVLIITCPCALGLAIPTVQTVASGAMFKAGVLLNSGDAIERLAEADHVIFDKTGTLTLPDLEVMNAADIPADIFELVGCLALSSHHPVAAAVALAAGARSPIVGAVEEAGQGVRAVVDGVEFRLGRPSFCRAEALVGSATLDPEASIVAFSKGNERFILSVRQGLRPDAQAVIAALKARNIGIEILSGDREPAVIAVAHALGIAEWRAGVTPADKIARIEELKRRGAKVLMVGDGMNDAPSLAAAHVSMSPISAAHLSQATADLVFLGRPLAPVVAAIDSARKALHLMRQNLWLAIGYNVLAVPVAISGVVTPLIAAAAMSGSSILVMLNSLRARNASREIE
ncbi:cation-translocating P-type ATPase [Bradyrhizobium japonicum]|uniref:cation-translocating P-type ATPase n=1 Tax=Bradyrhizobium japonicum TaxID=375 RepID=UPI000456C59C|nr:cation-translocating P-type ATPase [Bradyrhizobium japonicum]AHY52307.1 E1-E2 type cation ATPase [Bradyrhizobium japonicum SEMIA 5079]MCD9111267.1 cation-translocating P-type ATPase [Bradyrhizobium japonicum]MCD9255617.1 cation-translocating P-type ATPase [Bradyrhizobium japonicum SEMIA 5079]MCD9822874.1 cation-translocating P-type ATPase [Bradyrhizobium japonicum]MCD9893651.1 cation-translocating P-type ATPase [Bradyrhizobium japonicum]